MSGRRAGWLTRWRERRGVRAHVKDAIDAELEFHVEMQTRRYIADGAAPDDARRRARQRLGHLTGVRGECHEISHTGDQVMTRTQWWSEIRQDAAYAVRLLRRAPIFTVTALVTIALGVGATTAIFSVVDDVLLRRLPYGAGDRTVMVWNAYRGSTTDYTAVAAAEFADLRDHGGVFDSVAALQPQSTTLAGGCAPGGACEPERVMAYAASANIFDLLMVAPAIGRPFTPADGVTGAAPVVLIGDGVWRRRFGADREIVGRTIEIGGRARTVIGVLPAGVRFPDAPLGFAKEPGDVWIPFNWEQRRTDGRGNQNLAVLARLRAGTPVARAQGELDLVADQFRAGFPQRYARAGVGWSLAAIPLRDQMVGDVRPELLVLLGAVGLVLLIACTNVAHLLLARGAGRGRELAIRSALGAGRGRLVRQLLIETAVLASIGGALGVVLAGWGLGALVALDAGSIPYLHGATLNGGVLAFSLLVTMATGALVGLAPAMRQSRVTPQAAIGDGSRGGQAAPIRRGLRHALVVVEVALALVVLTGAGLLVRTFAALGRVPAGFDASHVVTFSLTPSRAQYDSPAKLLAFHQDVAARLAALPGVTQASGVYPLPMGGEQWSGSFGVEGLSVGPGDPEPHAEYHVALPGYFGTVRIPLLEGREFTADDTTASPQVAIVDEALAKKYWPGQSALGKRLDIFGGAKIFTKVVGVAGHVHVAGPRSEGEPQIYLPLPQNIQSPMYFVARTAGDAGALVPAVRQAVHGLNNRIALAKLGPMTDLVAQATARERFNTLLFSLFGVLALALAAVGLYGVMAFLVEQRTREIGIRLALGGEPAHVMRRVMGEGLSIAAAGVLVGLAVALPLSRLLGALLFGIAPTDPITYGAIAAIMLVVALVATFVPARRAMRVDPVEVLKA